MKSGIPWLICVLLPLGGGSVLGGGATTGVISAAPVGSAGRSSGAPVAAATAPVKPFTTITADLLDSDYDKRVAIFEGNVVAVDPKLTLKCKTMKVFFGEKGGEVIRVEAFHDVRMFHEGREGVGDKAVFTRETGLIVLTGTRPKLKDEKGNWILSQGEGIIYNPGTKKMHVDKPLLEFQPSDGGAGKNPPAKPTGLNNL